MFSKLNKIHSKFNSIKSIDYCHLLIVSIPLTLITGPFLPDISVVLINIFFFYHIYKTKDYSILKNNFFVFFLFFWLYISVRSLFVDSKYILFSLQSSFFYFRFGFFSLCFFYLLNNNKNILSHFFWSLVVVASALIIDGYFQFFYGVNILGYSKFGFVGSYDVIRLGSLFGNELILGSYLSKFFGLILFFLLYKFFFINYALNSIKIIFFLLVFILIYLSGERAAFYITIINLFLIILYVNKRNLITLVGFLFISTILILIINNNYSLVKNRMFPNFAYQLNPINNLNELRKDSSIEIFSPDHTKHYKIAINMFKNNILFGQGPKMFRQLCGKSPFALNENLDDPKNGCTTHPHNTYLQLLSETGLIGFLFFFVPFIFTTIFLIRFFFIRIFLSNNKNFEMIIPIISAYTLFFPFMSTGSFLNNWVCIVYFSLISIAIYYYKLIIK